MREIKFRAWDKVLKEMDTPPMISDKYAAEWKDVDDIFTDSERIFMQYTGRKDKNEKEIYESDILKNVWGWNDAEFEVQWDLNGFRLRCIRDFYAGPNNNVIYAENDQWIDLPAHTDLCEITGNIYEYPHLLKGIKLTKETNNGG